MTEYEEVSWATRLDHIQQVGQPRTLCGVTPKQNASVLPSGWFRYPITDVRQWVETADCRQGDCRRCVHSLKKRIDAEAARDKHQAEWATKA